jgi:hypothetical protein
LWSTFSFEKQQTSIDETMKKTKKKKKASVFIFHASLTVNLQNKTISKKIILREKEERKNSEAYYYSVHYLLLFIDIYVCARLYICTTEQSKY